jgi:hypothetical protein
MSAARDAILARVAELAAGPGFGRYNSGAADAALLVALLPEAAVVGLDPARDVLRSPRDDGAVVFHWHLAGEGGRSLASLAFEMGGRQLATARLGVDSPPAIPWQVGAGPGRIRLDGRTDAPVVAALWAAYAAHAGVVRWRPLSDGGDRPR